VTAVCLHNMLVDDMVVNYKDARVGRGASLMNYGMYLDGHTDFPVNPLPNALIFPDLPPPSGVSNTSFDLLLFRPGSCPRR
jgi:hypothetical protein